MGQNFDLMKKCLLTQRRIIISTKEMYFLLEIKIVTEHYVYVSDFWWQDN